VTQRSKVLPPDAIATLSDPTHHTRRNLRTTAQARGVVKLGPGFICESASATVIGGAAGRRAQQRIQIEDQNPALAAWGDCAKSDPELDAVIRLHAVQ
jgi:hypothetical protein